MIGTVEGGGGHTETRDSGTDISRMLRFHCENAGGIAKNGAVLNQWSGASVGSHSNILESPRKGEELGLVAKPHAKGVQVDRRFGDCSAPP